MRIARRFVWSDGRPDDHEEIRSAEMSHLVQHQGAWFNLRTWDVRYTPGEPRITETIYDQASRP